MVVVVVALGDKVGPISSQLLEVLLLGILGALLVLSLVVRVQVVPHRGHVLGHITKAGIGVASLDACLHVAKEERICRHRLLRLIGVSLLLAAARLPRPLLH